MIEVDEFFRPAHHDLVYELETNGFTSVGQDSWKGELRVGGATWRLKVDMSSPYPAHPPRVLVEDDKPLSWHQNADGSLCLYSQSSPGAFPWFAHGALLERIRSWFEEDAAGWVGDFPDLDLERYWKPDTRFELLVHNELPDRDTYWIRLGRFGPKTLMQKGFSSPPRQRPRSHKHLYGLSAAIGEVTTPPRSWAELTPFLEDADGIEGALRDRRADVLLLRYTRDNQKGVLGLVPVPRTSNQDLQFRAVSCASCDPETMALRAGFQSPELGEKSVIVVGVGAVGSFVAEGLFRSGVRRLFLVDKDRLRPGNLIRHAAPGSLVGKSKAEAMAETLGAPVRAQDINIYSLSQAIELVQRSDLVIDATANEVVTQLLTEAGRLTGSSILSVYLSNQGRSKVVEVLPSPTGNRVVPQDMAPAAPDGVESGCGDPVSTTPPFAVIEVAGMACRVAAAMLVHDTASAKSELREQP